MATETCKMSCNVEQSPTMLKDCDELSAAKRSLKTHIYEGEFDMLA